MKIKIILTNALMVVSCFIYAQDKPKSEIKYPELKKNFNDDGSHFIKATVVGQFWTRYTDLNPGSTLKAENNTTAAGTNTASASANSGGYGNVSPFDIGIRRLRFNVMAQLTDRVFFYCQFGQNNFNYTSTLYSGSFVHDAVGEYKIHKSILTIGTGLSGWSGLTRFAAPGVGSIMGIDAPLYQQVTNGVNDQFLRKLSIYAKGKIGKLDYRLALSKPMIGQNSSVILGALNSNSATFSYLPPKVQTQGYINYQFLDKEDNTLAYTSGTYHGKKKIFNLGVGWINQNKALWIINSNGDTISKNMTLLGTDVFIELPLSEKRNAITAYIAYTDYQMGKNYIRNVGAMNPANKVNSAGSFNGPGNAAPIIGTGQTIYALFGYKFKDNLLKEQGSLQAYTSIQYSKYQALKDPMIIYEAGLNWLINGDHHSKLTLGYQSRPIYRKDLNGDLKVVTTKGMLVLQYQISF
ncbi:MAG: hypothetical protein HYR91_12595 [Flavobacteriia bacterium]|nr:hypothetical protein [Flavobacteriia bacterium]